MESADQEAERLVREIAQRQARLTELQEARDRELVEASSRRLGRPAPSPLMGQIGELVGRGGRYAPRWGWHDDHRAADGTPAYLPALQQVRAEYKEFLEVLAGAKLSAGYPDRLGYSCLQLGMGECRASHDAWLLAFENVLTLDWGATVLSYEVSQPGYDVASGEAIAIAQHFSPYDMLFIDAGHSAEDARRDHANYGPMVRPGGIIAFHDALRRPGFEEAVRVWEYLETIQGEVNVIGSEVGVAWLRKE